MRLIFLFSVMIISTFVSANDCSSVIALAKTTSEAVQDKSFIENSASNFCKEYKKYQQDGRSGSISASYKLFSASTSSGSSSIDDIASKYCSSSTSGEARESAYRQYIETISPHAYDAYEQCLKMSKGNLNFLVDIATILPEEFSVSVEFTSNVHNDDAKLSFRPSNGIHCSWHNKLKGADITLENASSGLLNCNRQTAKKPGYVKIIREDGVGSLSLRWPAYNEDGIPFNAIKDLEKRHSELSNKADALLSSLQDAIIPFEAENCPSGWSPYVPAYGLFIRGIDPTGETDVDRAELPIEERLASIQQDSLASHLHKYALSSDRRGHPSESGDTSNGTSARQSYWRGNKEASQNSETSPIGDLETRPKNIALLYCKPD